MRTSFLNVFLPSLASIFLVLLACTDKTNRSSDDSPDLPSPSADPQPGADNGEDPPSPEPTPNPFLVKIEPNLASVQKDLVDNFCTPCHQGAMAPRHLDLSDLSRFFNGERDVGGYRGRLIVPRKSLDSMLVMIISTNNLSQKMPPVGSGYPAVNEQQLAALKQWIDQLAPSPGNDDEPGGDDEPGE